MALIYFTQHLARFVACPDQQVDARCLRDALEASFQIEPRLRGYLLDDQGRLRKHVTVMIDGVRARDRNGLSDAVGAHSKIHVLQALSGG